MTLTKQKAKRKLHGSPLTETSQPRETINITSTDPVVDSNIRSRVVKLVKEGRENFRMGHYAMAREIFEAAIGLENSNTYALVGLADTFRRQEQYKEAIDQYRKVLDKDPGNPFALLGIGDSFRGVNRLDRSIEVWSTLLKLQPDNVQILTRLGDAHRKLAQFHDAVRSYSGALEYDPYNPYSLRGLADSYRGLMDHTNAAKAWETYNMYHPGNVSVLGRLGDAYKQLDMLERAEKIYFETFKIEKEYVYSLLGLADVERKRGDAAKSLDYWRRATRANPYDLAPICRKADFFRKTADFEPAKILYMMGLEVDPDNKFLLTGLASLEIDQKDFDGARKAFERLLTRHPEDEFVLTGLGDSCRGLGDYERAVESWKKAFSLAPHNPFLAARIGTGYRFLGNDAESCHYFTKTLELDNHNKKAIQGLSSVLRKEGPMPVIADRWLLLAAEQTIADDDLDGGRRILQRLSPEGKKLLPPALINFLPRGD